MPNQGVIKVAITCCFIIPNKDPVVVKHRLTRHAEEGILQQEKNASEKAGAGLRGNLRWKVPEARTKKLDTIDI
jgi:hypothetical protein